MITLTFDDYEFNVSDWLNNIDFKNITKDILEEELYEAICQFADGQFDYWQDALDFLNTHDVCLRDSLALAADCGYNCRDLNGSILAYLLLKEKLTEQLNTAVNQILELITAEIKGV